jgi:hypothetical protein
MLVKLVPRGVADDKKLVRKKKFNKIRNANFNLHSHA